MQRKYCSSEPGWCASKFRNQPVGGVTENCTFSFLLYLTLKIAATFVPYVCLKNLHRRVLIKRYSFYNQLDGSLELCHVAKHLQRNSTWYRVSLDKSHKHCSSKCEMLIKKYPNRLKQTKRGKRAERSLLCVVVSDCAALNWIWKGVDSFF